MSDGACIDEDRRSVLLLGNRNAGAGGALDSINELVDRLRQLKFDVQLSFDVDEFRQLFVQTPSSELRCVISAGGDGTAELVASICNDVPLAVFPMGTENLLAKHLGITQDAEALAQVIADGHLTEIDFGIAGTRRFLLMLSCGFDAEVVRRLHEDRSGNINHLSYAKPILDAIRNYQYPSLTLTYWDSENESHVIQAYWAFVFNVPTYAAGLGICSNALPDDGLLDIVTFQGSSFWHGLYHLSAVVLRQHQNLNEFDTFRAKRVRIESDAEVPYQIDGDPGGFLPVDITVSAERISLLVPADHNDK